MRIGKYLKKKATVTRVSHTVSQQRQSDPMYVIITHYTLAFASFSAVISAEELSFWTI